MKCDKHKEDDEGGVALMNSSKASKANKSGAFKSELSNSSIYSDLNNQPFCYILPFIAKQLSNPNRAQ